MKLKKVAPLFILFAVPLMCLSQNTLRLIIKGVESGKGFVSTALYTDQESFLKFDKVFRTTSEKAVKGDTELEIRDVPNGTYAVAVFHDENGNAELDTNFIGIPRETVAFSNAKMKMFGPPKFEESSFKVTSDMEITIKME